MPKVRIRQSNIHVNDKTLQNDRRNKLGDQLAILRNQRDRRTFAKRKKGPGKFLGPFAIFNSSQCSPPLYEIGVHTALTSVYCSRT
jgi:hypothetical protein